MVVQVEPAMLQHESELGKNTSHRNFAASIIAAPTIRNLEHHALVLRISANSDLYVVLACTVTSSLSLQ